MDQATVGRRISSLQERLGTKLFEKRSDGFFLTAAGSRIIEDVEAAETAMLAVDRAIIGEDERLEGVVKVAMPGALANQCLIGSLRPFLKQYPYVELQFLTGPELLNLSRREADIAIRLVRPKQRDLKVKQIGTLQLGLYGSKKLALDKIGGIQNAPFIGLFNGVTSELEKTFLESLKFAPRYCIRSGAWSSVYAALTADLGIGILPTFIGAKDKNLKLLRKETTSCPIWLVVHREVASRGRVRAEIKHFEGALS